MLRSQAQAEYVSDNYGHFGLHLRRYAHFTSPIRRYADLIVHRALIRALGLGDHGLPDLDADTLAGIAQRISAAERRAMTAERETIDRLIAAHLADKIGGIFEGRIAGVTRAGLFVKLRDTARMVSYRRRRWARSSSGSRRPSMRSSGRGAARPTDLATLSWSWLVEAAPFAGALAFRGGAG